jgi:hypothetical protein
MDMDAECRLQQQMINDQRVSSSSAEELELETRNGYFME